MAEEAWAAVLNGEARDVFRSQETRKVDKNESIDKHKLMDQ